jgi:hypothetical protein
VVLGARGFCILFASLRARLRRVANFFSISLVIVGHSYVSWVAVQSGALKRRNLGDLFLMAVFALFFCLRSFRAFFVGLYSVLHSPSVSFLFVVGRGVGFAGSWGVGDAVLGGGHWVLSGSGWAGGSLCWGVVWCFGRA